MDSTKKIEKLDNAEQDNKINEREFLILKKNFK